MVRDSRMRSGYSAKCKACLRAANRRIIDADRDKHNEARRAKFAEDGRTQMLMNARQRAKARGVPCTITVEDIVVPRVCPALGMALQRGTGAPTSASPSLDCVNPALGYVPGNVEVLSQLANRIKSNATPEEVLAVGLYLMTKRKSLLSN